MNSKQPAHTIRDMRESYSMLTSAMDRMGVVYPGMADGDRLNVYRELRGKLLRLAEQQNFVCMVCTLDPKGNSGVLSVNLGAVFAFDPSKSAVVIDCDIAHTLIDELLLTREKRPGSFSS